MKKIILIAFVFATASVFAQNANEALRYSQLSYSGTARFTALSGAYGALGGDFSTLSQNPAGLGVYRRSEFTISPGMYSKTINSEYFGESAKESKTNLTFNNLGLVLSFGKGLEEKSIRSINMGFGFNRSNSFGGNLLVNGFNNQSSLLNQYVDDFNSNNPDDYGSWLAWGSYLINKDSASGTYYGVIDRNISQAKSADYRGSMREGVFSLGANFEDKLFFGMTIGFPRIDYEESSFYEEKDTEIDHFDFKSFGRSESLKTTGTGVNFKFGMIYKPVDFLRLGLAFHTPTRYDMHDVYNASITSHFDNGDTYTMDPINGVGEYDYNLTTPMKVIGSAAVIVGSTGLLSADYEFIDYSTARYSPVDNYFMDVNNTISSEYTAVHNIRVGTEWNVSNVALRGGVNYSTSPYKNFTENGSGLGYSAGIGLREKDFFLDFAFTHNQTNDNYYIYSSQYTDPAKMKYAGTQFVVTLGIKM